MAMPQQPPPYSTVASGKFNAMGLLSVILEVQGWVVGEVLPRDHYLLAVFVLELEHPRDLSVL
jgi:hypothetical protein